MKRIVGVAGNGAFGRLGLGIESKSSLCFRVLGSLVGYEARQVACGGAHTVVVTEDGTLFTWGLNDKGQLGHSAKEKFVPVPIEVTLPDPVDCVAAGEYHTLALTRAGEVWAWGSHESGQLGIGTEVDQLRQPEPRLVKALSGVGVRQLVAGFEHSLALSGGSSPRTSTSGASSSSSRGGSGSRKPSDVWAWGNAAYGALGIGAATAAAGRGELLAAPRRLRGTALEGADLVSLTVGPYSSGAVDAGGRAWTWGQGTYHQLGHGTAAHEHAPREVLGLGHDCASLALGHMHGLASGHMGGRLCAWGSDEHGSLGQGEGNWQRVPLAVPQPVAGEAGTGVAQVAAGWKSSAAVTRDGRLFAWGWAGAYNTDAEWAGMFTSGEGGAGMLGLGDNRDRWAPNQVLRLHTTSERFYDLRMPYAPPFTVKQVALGRTHSAAIFEVKLDVRDLN